MILVRQPHCWRFLFPLPPGVDAPGADELKAKARHFIGNIDDIQVLNTVIYRVHHRVASTWRQGRVFLMGDAAHLITPMWALGLNTGILDAIALPWRLAWVLRGWAGEGLLDGYTREQRPIAVEGSGEMAEAARKYMAGQKDDVRAMSGNEWANAATRTMLGVQLDVDQGSRWSMVKTELGPLQVGDRVPDAMLHGPQGHPVRLHDLIDNHFVALYFTDGRRRPSIPANDRPGLRHFMVSRWDAPLDSGLRDRALLDVGDRFRKRVGCVPDTVLLIRPDDHIAAIVPMTPGVADKLYCKFAHLNAATPTR
jgi:3-(3-hydroxy-phenyl)propionate hydroxylase